jgi:hypothetical protein
MTTATENAKRLPMITPARVGYTKDRISEMCLADKKKEHKLFHVVGTAAQAIVKPSDTFDGKESIEFRGTFLAIDVETGESYKSGKVYLPTIIEAELAAQVQKNSAVRISLTVGAQYAQKSATSYGYTVESHGEEDNSAFDDLLALIPGIGNGHKQIAAPAKKKK